LPLMVTHFPDRSSASFNLECVSRSPTGVATLDVAL
jgi:hypothetical protein